MVKSPSVSEGTLVSPLVEEDPTSCGASKLHATTTEPEL